MTTFADGPAEGQTLMLKRAPIFLRVTELLGEFDGLDQLNDTPEPGETLHAYQLTKKPGAMHIRAARNARVSSGFYTMAKYELCKVQPLQEVMRDTHAWQEWTRQQEPPEFLTRKDDE